jgi:hypothetical protein
MRRARRRPQRQELVRQLAPRWPAMSWKVRRWVHPRWLETRWPAAGRAPERGRVHQSHLMRVRCSAPWFRCRCRGAGRPASLRPRSPYPGFPQPWMKMSSRWAQCCWYRARRYRPYRTPGFFCAANPLNLLALPSLQLCSPVRCPVHDARMHADVRKLGAKHARPALPIAGLARSSWNTRPSRRIRRNRSKRPPTTIAWSWLRAVLTCEPAAPYATLILRFRRSAFAVGHAPTSQTSSRSTSGQTTRCRPHRPPRRSAGMESLRSLCRHR